MGAQWAAHLPQVTVGRGEPKPITFVYPFYENPIFLARQVEGWWQYPSELIPYLTAIVVDDGSPEPARLPPAVPFLTRLFRIEVDRRWNWIAARNIGAHHAADGWLLLTDMDHVVPPETAAALIYGEHDPAVAYAFWRREYTGPLIHPHSASWFLTRTRFWAMGGYDEALSGYYGSDGDFRRRLPPPHAVLTDLLVRYEHVDDASTKRYQRKAPEDRAIHALIAKRPAHGWRPRVLSFPYHEVTP